LRFQSILTRGSAADCLKIFQQEGLAEKDPDPRPGVRLDLDDGEVFLGVEPGFGR